MVVGQSESVMKEKLRKLICFGLCLLVLVPAMAEERVEPVRVACVGDSITYGAGIPEREEKSYPSRLAELLGEGWLVKNFGRNGRTVLKNGHAPYWETPEYRKALRFKPEVVIIMLGTNDSRPPNWPAHKDEFVPDYVSLVRSFQRLESKPVVWICNPIPAFGDLKGISETVISGEIIPMIREIAKQTNVGIVDLHSVFDDRNDLQPDLVHPNSSGAERIARTVAKVVAAGAAEEARGGRPAGGGKSGY